MFSNVSDWQSDWWKGAVTADLVAGAAAIGGGAIIAPAALTAGLGATGASIAIGAAEGVGTGVLSTELTSIAAYNGHSTFFSWDWDKMFTATLSGAITGALSSAPIKNGIDNGIASIFGTTSKAADMLPKVFQGLSSKLLGGVISTAISGFDEKGGSWNTAFDGTTQWFNLEKSVVTSGFSFAASQVSNPLSNYKGGGKVLNRMLTRLVPKVMSTGASTFVGSILTMDKIKGENNYNGNLNPSMSGFDFGSLMKTTASMLYQLVLPK
jgi:hypothetical protein